MKKLLLAAVAFALFATSSSFAQGKIAFGIGVDLGLPMTSGFSDTQGIGIGGTARVYYPLSDQRATLTGTAGYMTFSGKDFTSGGVTVTAGSWSMVPVLVGGRYYFSPMTSTFRPYGAFEMGIIFGSYSVPTQTFGGQTFGGSVSTTDFTYQPALGFVASQFDVAVRLLGVSSATCIAFRAGYIFN